MVESKLIKVSVSKSGKHTQCRSIIPQKFLNDFVDNTDELYVYWYVNNGLIHGIVGKYSDFIKDPKDFL